MVMLLLRLVPLLAATPASLSASASQIDDTINTHAQAQKASHCFSQDPFKFERPQLIGESPPASVTGANFSHFWFPEEGGVIGKPGEQQAVVVGVRFNGDGSAALPLHTYESLVSYDQGSSWAHLGWTQSFNGVPTQKDVASGDLLGSCCFVRSADNRSFTGRRQRTSVLPNKTIVQTILGDVTYSGFPFPVATFTYTGALVSTTADDPSTLVQTVAYSHHMSEKIWGPDENLAGFRSTDGGIHWEFQQVIASHNATLRAKHWEGPGENDIVRLSDNRLLTIFRVDSCHPYWKSLSTNGGVSWSLPEALPFGSARPKLLRMPNGQPLLAGGRPGLWLRLGDTDGNTWSSINVCAVHNKLLPDEPSWRYSESVLNGTSSNCNKGGVNYRPPSPDSPGGPPGSTAYTSLLELAPGKYLLEYDRLANGWHMPPGPYGDKDMTFSMVFSWTGEAK